jgi:hypothetical protein
MRFAGSAERFYYCGPEKTFQPNYNRMKRIALLTLTFLLTLSSFPQQTTKPVYSGGMLILQPGYAMTTTRHQKINQLGFGIGGILRFYFLNNGTAGIFGGSQRTGYSSGGSENSYLNLGYGGPFAGFSHKKGKFRYTASVFAGKGSIKNLHIGQQTDEQLLDAYWKKHPVWVFSPILSIDYSLSQKLLVTLQAVCLTAKYDGDRRLYNPTLQLGVLFNR